MVEFNDNSSIDEQTTETAHSARRALLRSSPGVLARLIGSPIVAIEMAHSTPPVPHSHATASERALPVRAPLFDVLDEGDELLVVADLPGLHLFTIQLTLDHNTLCLQPGNGGDGHRCDLPADVDASTLRWAARNSILEVRVQKRSTEVSGEL